MTRSLLLVFLLACSAKNNRADVDPTPSWATSDGRTQAKIELAEALVVNGTPEAALQMISQMVERSPTPRFIDSSRSCTHRHGLG